VLATLDPTSRSLFSEIEKVAVYCLAVPASVAGCERTFSAMRRLKTWLRSTIVQRCFTQLALLHVHKEIVDTIHIDSIMADFVARRAERRSVFGAFRSKLLCSIK